MATDESIRLEFSDIRPPLSIFAEINAALVEIGTGVWPLDLTAAPADVRHC